MFLNDKIVALVTPYNSYQQVDIDSLINYVSYLKNHTPFNCMMIICSTGDQMALSADEKSLMIHQMINHFPDTNFIFGISSTSTTNVNEIIDLIRDINPYPDIMLGIPPYMLPNQNEIQNYVNNMAKIIPSNILLYNNYRRTGVNIDVDTVRDIIKTNKNIVALKEAGTNLLSELDGITVYTGSDLAMINQAYYGATSPIASILPYCSSYFIDKKNIHDIEFEQDYRQLLSNIIEIGLVKVVKTYLLIKGIIKCDQTRLPMLPCSDEQKAWILQQIPLIERLEQQAKEYMLK